MANKRQLGSTLRTNDIYSWLQEAGNAAMDSSKRERNRGYSYSPKEIAEKQFARMETEDERQYQQDFYDRNYSFQGQVNQMQDAGLNPSLMYGQMGSTASSGSSGDTISAPADSQTEDSPMSQFGAVVNFLTSMLGISTDAANLGNTMANSKVQRDAERANTRLTNAEAEKVEFDNSKNLERWDFEVTSRNLDNALKQCNIDLTEKNLALADEQIKNLQSNTDLNNLRYSQETRLFQAKLLSAWQDLKNKQTEGYNLRIQGENLRLACQQIGEEIKKSQRANDYAALAKTFGLSDSPEDLSLALLLGDYAKYVPSDVLRETVAGIHQVRLRGEYADNQVKSVWSYASMLFSDFDKPDELKNYDKSRDYIKSVTKNLGKVGGPTR